MVWQLNMQVKLIKLETSIKTWEGFNKRIKSNNSLTLGNTYEVIRIFPIEKNNNISNFLYDNREPNFLSGDCKIIDNNGNLDTIPSDCVEIIDKTIPDFWIEQGLEGYRYLAPKEWGGDFFQRYKMVMENH